MTIDYEAEYNNRARVPEHPGLIAGWARDAAAYRETARGELGLAYGPTERTKLDLFGDGSGPIVLFIHGGYWQGLDRASFSHLARGLVSRGFTMALPSYDLCPAVTVATIVDQIRQACAFLWRRFERPITVAGHSAGGHLAACMLATRWREVDPALPPGLAHAAYGISGLYDLAPLVGTSVNTALGLDAAEAKRLSPLFWEAPRGKVFDAVVGGGESGEYLRQSRSIAEAWGNAGVMTRYEALEGENHFTVIAPLADPESPMTRRLAQLAEMAGNP
ncbi:alpha/beta hydrolase [Alsobacter soli]|uniref:Alpha/beta hydrolase n=1 Tax=Alsobacter soli TaxID=2109933 RepID=A0A2T1HQN7_9HYPH|nr:alpha/beta hydrolase [Alsobacter soli]PSC03942.1 alpha/beta hydrolase [Alsobacter soli]